VVPLLVSLLGRGILPLLPRGVGVLGGLLGEQGVVRDERGDWHLGVQGGQDRLALEGVLEAAGEVGLRRGGYHLRGGEVGQGLWGEVATAGGGDIGHWGGAEDLVDGGSAPAEGVHAEPGCAGGGVGAALRVGGSGGLGGGIDVRTAVGQRDGAALFGGFPQVAEPCRGGLILRPGFGAILGV